MADNQNKEAPKAENENVETSQTETQEPTGCKVFIGNLSFKTTPEGLKTFFEECGEILDTSVITRGRRSLGYGFIDFADKETADKALETMNKKELDGREINLELARPRDPSKPKPQRRQGSRKRQGGYRRDYDRRPPPRRFDGPPRRDDRRGDDRRGYRVSGYRGDGYRDGGYRDGGYRDGGYRDGGYRDNYRGPPRQYRDDYYDDRRRDYRPRSRPRSEPRYDDGYRSGGYQKSQGNRRRRRRNDSEKDREPSTTTLFVTNLPFSLNDDGLKEAFEGFDTVKCYVVHRRNGRSKGYGFVEFKEEKDQQDALDAVNGKNIEGRDLVVKVAYASQTGEHNADAQTNTEEEKN